MTLYDLQQLIHCCYRTQYYHLTLTSCVESSKNPKKNVTDIRMLNLARMKTLNVSEVSNKPPPSLPCVEHDKIDKKIALALEQKRRAVEKIGINVTPGAQKLFDTINKT